jgi:hypothetical protein
MSKVIQVPLSDLKTSFYVRKKLNEDHVLQLSLLYEAGEKLPPLEIGWDNEVIDGRHRKAALELLGRTTADCHVHGQRGVGESIVIALKANVGGALPPTKEDVVHSMILLLNQGWTQRRIIDNMPFPADVTRIYIKNAWSIVLDAKLQSALKAISEEGCTVKVAAEKYGVPIEKIQDRLTPKKRKKDVQTPAWRKSHISRLYQGFHRKIAYEFQQIIRDYEDHKMTDVEVYDLIDGIYDLIKNGEKRLDDHRSRFTHIAEEISKLSSIEMSANTIKKLSKEGDK